jgi:radical SAM superfamily enzyme YgiQ (UPF0313 family)
MKAALLCPTLSDPTQIPPALPRPRIEPARPRTVLFVMPFYPKDTRGSLGKHVLTPALTFSALAAVTPPTWSIRYWDENLLQGPPPLSPLPEVVGITVHLTFARRAYELAAWFRAHGCLVVMGGLHALSCPDEVAAHCDALAIGNGVPLWPRILADIERRCLRPRYQAPFESFATEPLPDRSIIPRVSFLTTASLIATRGCHNRCDFCYLATGTQRTRYQTRPPAEVARELAELPEPYGVFVDNNLGASRPYLHRLCRALAPVGKIWSAAVSLDVTDEPALVAEMAAAGCTGVFIGFESLSDENMRQAGKRCPPAEDWGRRVALFHRHGIQVNGSFVLGFDHDRPDVFARTADWVEKNRLECATFHIMTPYPGTPLFARLAAEGRILHRDWDRYDTAHAVFRPRHMTPEALEAGYAWLYRRVFSLRSIWARRPARASAVLPYLLSSLLYKKANPLWRLLIRHRLTHAMWRPLVAAAAWSHRKRFAQIPIPHKAPVHLEVVQ